MTAVAELRNVTKSYAFDSQKIDALRGVNLRLSKGVVAAITGKSGAGKSTLLHIIGSLDRPSAGKVSLNGVEVSGMSDQVASTFRNKTVGFIFQMNNLLPEFSALENVMLPGLIAGHEKRELRERANKILKSVGLGHRLSHRPGELSGGEQQRVAISRALVMNPPLLLADEPTGNLDRKTSLAVQDLLLQLCADHHITMLLVTHDPELAKRLPHQVVMEDGLVVSGGSL
jgi:lipoprotein-releasing system ATP-binding protein